MMQWMIKGLLEDLHGEEKKNVSYCTQYIGDDDGDEEG